MSKLNPYAKAIVSAALAGLAAVGVAITDGQVTAVEYVVIASAVVGTLATIWGVPNAKEKVSE